ncbi:hypothetical protein [Nostoc sp. CALU 546]
MFPILLEKIIILAVSVSQPEGSSQPPASSQPGNEIPCLKAKVV